MQSVKRRQGKLQAVSRKAEVIELRKLPYQDMADALVAAEGKIIYPTIGRVRRHPRGRRTWHATKADW